MLKYICMLWGIFTIQQIDARCTMRNIHHAYQANTDTITGKVHQMDEVKVSTEKRPKILSATTPVQVLTNDDIKDLGIQNLADAVKRFAGTNVRDYGGIGGMKTVSVRNLGAAHTAVSYDGVVVSNTQAGQIDIGRFSIDNVGTLSLAIGQSDNLKQSARSFASAGILNIQTEKPAFENGRKSSFKWNVKGGSFGYATTDLRWNQKLGESTIFSASGNFMRADGNYPFTLTNGKYVTKEKRNNSDIDTWHSEVNLLHTFKDDSRLTAKGYYFYSKRGLPGSVTLYNPQANERLWDENFFMQAHYSKDFSEKWALNIRAKFDHSWNKYTDKDVKYQDGMEIDINRQNEYYLSANVQFKPCKNFTFSLVQDGAVNKLRNNLDDCPYPTRYTSLTAFNAHYQRQGVTINATLVNTYITERVKSGNKPDDRKRLTPNISATYQPFTDRALYIRAMYKNTFRVPTFNDLYYLRIGNRNLRPEKAAEYNLGLTCNIQANSSIIEDLQLTADGYYNTVSDKIVAFPTTYVWKMANYGKVHITGLDITANVAFRVSKQIKLRWNGSLTVQKAIDLTDPDGKSYKDQLPYTPKISGATSWNVENPWLNFSYSIIGMGKRYFLSQNIDSNKIDGYLEHSFTCWKNLKFKSFRMRLQGEILNLTNKQYDIIKYYPMPGRSWRLSCTIDI